MQNELIYKSLSGRLLPWYYEHKRDLPWRKDKIPYHVWLSEIMLQQTRVEAVKGYYLRFLEELPTIADLAAAEDELIHKLWEGLGYYSRVRNLKKAAQIIMEHYSGKFPEGYDAVLSLPGIGEYTAGAICSIAFNQPTPAVDGNVLRVIARLTNDDTPIDLPGYKKQVRSCLADTYPKNAGDFTQALMELGATICGPNRKPDCAICPCRDICLACANDNTENVPVKHPKRLRIIEEKTVFIISCDGRYALEKRPEGGLLAGLWQFPNLSGKLDITDALNALEDMGLCPREILQSVDRKHIFTHIQWEMRGIYVEVKEQFGKFEWLTERQIRENAALPTAFRQFWDVLEHDLPTQTI